MALAPGWSNSIVVDGVTYQSAELGTYDCRSMPFYAPNGLRVCNSADGVNAIGSWPAGTYYFIASAYNLAEWAHGAPAFVASDPDITDFSQLTYEGGVLKSGFVATSQMTPLQAVLTSAAAVTLGNSCSLKWTPVNLTFRYKVRFSLGTWTYTTGFITPSGTGEYTYTGYAIPVTVAEQLPNDVRGTMTATLFTFSGNVQCGNGTQKTFTVNVPESVKPTFKSTPVLQEGTASGFGLYVIGLSTLKVMVKALGASGSIPKTASVMIGAGREYTANLTYDSAQACYTGTVDTDRLSVSGTLSVTVKVTDSRGRVVQNVQTITIYDYHNPSITDIEANVNGTTVTIKPYGSISAVNNTNTKRITLKRTKLSDNTTMTLLNNVTLNSYDVAAGYSGLQWPFTETVSDIETESYRYTIILTDSKGSQEYAKETGVICISRFAGGKGVAFFKSAEREGVDVNGKLFVSNLIEAMGIAGGFSTDENDWLYQLTVGGDGGGLLRLLDSTYNVKASINGQTGAASFAGDINVGGNIIGGGLQDIAICSCSTAAATAAKVVTVQSPENWTLKTGCIIAVKSTYTNTAQNPTLNVKGTGAKPVWYNASVVTTSALNRVTYANRYTFYMYNGTQWCWLSDGYDYNTTYSAATESANGLMTAADKKKINMFQMIACGSTTVSSSADATVTFATAFPSVPKVIVNFSKTGAPVSGDIGVLKVANKSTSGFTIGLYADSSTSRNVDWIAII